jgi:hypothetical protein
MYSEDVVARGRLRSLVIHLCGFLAASIPLSSFALTSMTVAWDSNTDPNVVGYKVYYGPAPGTYTNNVSVGNTTNATLSGMVEGSTYYLSATTLDNLGQESDFATEISYVVPLPASNQPPTLNAIANVTINENAAAQTVNLSGITSGATNEVQTLTVTAASSNPALIPTPTVSYTTPNATGSLSFTPVAFGFGTSTVTVTVNDNAGSNNISTRSFLVTVNPVNQPPTLNTLANLTINEGAGVQAVNLSGITSGATNENQTLTVTASSSNPNLISAPGVSYSSPNSTGSISFAPLGQGFGSSTITVTVNDGGASNNIVSRSFIVTVNPVNQAPTLNSIANVTVIENSGVQTVNLSGISAGATNEAQTLTVTATSGNTTILANPAVNYTSPNATGSLTFTPKTNAFGTATITVSVNDGGVSNNIVSRTFNVVVDAPPTISSIANRTITVNSATPVIAFTVGDAESTASSLITTAASSNQTLVPDSQILLGGSAANRTVTVTPATDQTGTANITIRVNDGVATSSTSFQLIVQGKPSAPAHLRVVAL